MLAYIKISTRLIVGSQVITVGVVDTNKKHLLEREGMVHILALTYWGVSTVLDTVVGIVQGSYGHEKPGKVMEIENVISWSLKS